MIIWFSRNHDTLSFFTAVKVYTRQAANHIPL